MCPAQPNLRAKSELTLIINYWLSAFSKEKSDLLKGLYPVLSLA